MTTEGTIVRRRRSHEETSCALVEAAAALFAEHPFEQVSVRQIAKRAGVNPALIYRYFGNKEGLLREALHHYENQTADAIPSAERYVDPVPLVRMVLENKQTVAALARAALDGSLPEMPVENRAVKALVARMEYRQAAEGGTGRYDPRVILFFLSCAVQGYALLGPYSKRQMGLEGMSDEELEHEFIELVSLMSDLIGQ